MTPPTTTPNAEVGAGMRDHAGGQLTTELSPDASHRGFRAALRSAPRGPLVLLAMVIAVAVLGPFLMDTSRAFAIDLGNRLLPPFAEPGHILGTDRNGRDVLTRLVLGARVSVTLGIVAIVLGGIWGTALGLLAGYRGGWVDTVLMRVVDVFLPFPTIVLALFVAVMFGPSFTVLVAVISTVLWARFARIVRGDAIAMRGLPFVEASIALGASPVRVMLRHMLPNLLSTVVVMATLQVGWVILIESSLSFLGAGIPPPAPTWGGMVADGKTHLQDAWWLSTIPGLAIMVTVMSMNVLGDWLRDHLDPRSTQREGA